MKKKILCYYLLISTAALFASQADLDMLFENLTELQTQAGLLTQPIEIPAPILTLPVILPITAPTSSRYQQPSHVMEIPKEDKDTPEAIPSDNSDSSSDSEEDEDDQAIAPITTTAPQTVLARTNPVILADGSSITLTADESYQITINGRNILIQKNGSQLTFSFATGAETPKIAAEGTDATTSPTTVTKPVVQQKNLLAGIQTFGGVKALRKAKPTAKPTAKPAAKKNTVAEAIEQRRKAMSGDPKDEDDDSSDDDSDKDDD